MMMIMMMRDLVLSQTVYMSRCGDGEYAKLNERDAWNDRWKKGGEEELIVFACLLELKKVYEIVVGEIVVCNLQANGILSKTWNYIRALYDGYLMSVWVKYLCFPQNTLCRKVFVMAVHNPQSTISF